MRSCQGSRKRKLVVLDVLQVVRLEHRGRWERQGVGSQARRAWWAMEMSLDFIPSAIGNHWMGLSKVIYE